MAVQAHKSRVLAGDFSVSAYASSVSSPLAIDPIDVTVFTDGLDRSYIPGMNTSTFSVSGFYAAAEHADLAAWATNVAQPVTYGISGLSVGSEVWMVNGVETAFTTTAAAADAVKFDLGAQTDGLTDFGVSLVDLASITTTSTGTAVDGGAASTTGAVAHLHITAYATLTSVIGTVQDSADGSTGWTTIGTFSTATAVTGERITIAGTVRRYTRAVLTLAGSGSATCAVALARR